MGKSKVAIKKGNKKLRSEPQVEASTSMAPPLPLGTYLKENDPIDASRFNNYRSQNYFYFHTNRPIHCERPFDYESFQLKVNFERRKWKKFCDEPKEKGNPIIVKEFYSNMQEPQMKEGYSIVRREVIYFEAEHINKFYELPKVKKEACEYYNAMNGDWRDIFDAVEKSLEGQKLRWVRNPDESPKHVLQTQFNIVAKGVHKFMCANIFPTSQHVKVTWNQAVMIHTIMSGGKIALGHIISKVIQDAGASKRGGFPFPSLITALVKAKGVNVEVDGGLLKISKPLSLHSLQSSQRKVKGMNAPENEDEEDNEEEEEYEDDEEEEDVDYMEGVEGERGDYGYHGERGNDQLMAHMDACFASNRTYMDEQFAALRRHGDQRLDNAVGGIMGNINRMMGRQDQLHDYLVRMAPQHDDGGWQNWNPSGSGTSQGPTWGPGSSQ